MSGYFKEVPQKIVWVAEPYKRWFRLDGQTEFFRTKKQCEEYHKCKAIKIVISDC